MTSSTAGAALTQFAEAIDAQDWPGLAALLAPGFTARYCHTGETFDAEAFVALNRDYPGRWRFSAEIVVDGGTTGVIRALVTDATGLSDEAHYVATFGAVDATGLLTSLDEVWAEVIAPPQGERRPASPVGGRS